MYGAVILKCNTAELNSLDRKTQKTMAIYDALHPKSNVDGIYVS